MKNRTLSKRVLPQLMLIVLLLVAFITFYHISVTRLLRDQASQDGTRLCNIYIREMDAVLTDVRRWLSVQFEDKNNLNALSGADEGTRAAARKKITGALSDATELYPSVAMAFLWTDEDSELLSAVSETVDYDRYEAMLDAAQRLRDFGKAFDTEWYVVPSGDECVFVTLMPVSAGMVGVFIAPETLLSSMPFYSAGERKFVLAKHSGYVVSTTLPGGYGEGIDFTGDLSGYYMTGERGDMIVCGAQSQAGPFRLMMVAKDADVLKGLAWTNWVLALAILLSALSIAGVIWSLRRYVLIPLNKTTDAIERFGRGDTNVRLETGGETREYEQIYQAFNGMAEQIKHLKIDNYEQTIHKQQAELRFYQTQIKPHFMLNCLTTINNLALQSKTEALKKFIADFSGFARCMFRSDYAPVKVSDELKQVDFYIGMQSVRYPGRIFYMPEADAAAKDALIPAMLIQTLVENSVKHGMDERGQLSIFVKCALDDDALTISVEDNGAGFSGAALEAVNGGTSIGFGLRNLQTTLELLFGDQAGLTAQNIPGSGAKVTVRVPKQTATGTIAGN